MPFFFSLGDTWQTVRNLPRSTMDSPESDREKALFRNPFSLYSNVRNAYKGIRKARPTSAHYDVAGGDPQEEKSPPDLTGATLFPSRSS